jgi:hypothetical protein
LAIPDWELNLFSADPRLLQPRDPDRYVQAARMLAAVASAGRLRLLHALVVGERTLVRAAVWADLPQTQAAADLAALERVGLVRHEGGEGPTEFSCADGHVIVLVHLALAHAHLALAPARTERVATAPRE